MSIYATISSTISKTISGTIGFGQSFVQRFGAGLSAAYFLADLGSKRGTVDGAINPVVRVRRTNGDLRAFTANDISTGVLLAWVGTGGSDNGLVAKLYDGSGNHRDATQYTVADMPKIVNAGAVVVDVNGNVSLDFAENKFLSANSLASIASGTDRPITQFQIADPDNDSASTSGIAGFGLSYNATPIRYSGIKNGVYLFDERANNEALAQAGGGTVASGLFLMSTVSTGNARTGRANGTQFGKNTTNLGETILDRFTIGALARNTVALYFSGKISGVIVYAADKTTDIPAAEAALAKEYKITLA